MVVWRYWHWWQCHRYCSAVLGNTRDGVVAVNGDFGDRMTGIKVCGDEVSAADNGWQGQPSDRQNSINLLAIVLILLAIGF